MAALLAAGCTGGKPPITDELTDLAGGDEKADFVAAKVKVVGRWDGSDVAVDYTSSPKYRAVAFTARPGQLVNIDVALAGPRPGKTLKGVPVTAPTADPVAWLTDATFHTIAMNDDASKDNVFSHIGAELPANRPATSHTYYVVLRDYDWSPATFTVGLALLAKPTGSLADKARAYHDFVLASLDWDVFEAGHKITRSALPAVAKARFDAEKANDGSYQTPKAYRFQVAGEAIYLVMNFGEEVVWGTLYDASGHFLAHGNDGDSGPYVTYWNGEDVVGPGSWRPPAGAPGGPPVPVKKKVLPDPPPAAPSP